MPMTAQPGQDRRDQREDAGEDQDQDALTLKETVVESAAIYEGKIVRLSLDTVRLPNGATARRELVRHPGAVAIAAIDDQKRLVMVRQWRHAASQVLLEIPAGTLHPGEPPDQCAIRELQEEAGFFPGKLERLGGIFVAPGYTTEYIHLYLATHLAPSQLALDDDEFLHVEYVPFDDVIMRIVQGDIQDAKTISAVFLAREQLAVG